MVPKLMDAPTWQVGSVLSAPIDRRIAAAVEAVTKDVSRPWTAAAMAELVHLSESRFAHLFRSAIGVSPVRFVLETRLLEGHRLLCDTFLSVKEVSVMVGFRDRSHFNRAFKTRFGITPGDLKRHSSK